MHLTQGPNVENEVLGGAIVNIFTSGLPSPTCQSRKALQAPYQCSTPEVLSADPGRLFAETSQDITSKELNELQVCGI